jgi:hypothetical protein
MVSELAQHCVMVAFDPDREIGRFWAASPAALVGLKEAAFGRDEAALTAAAQGASRLR